MERAVLQWTGAVPDDAERDRVVTLVQRYMDGLDPVLMLPNNVRVVELWANSEYQPVVLGPQQASEDGQGCAWVAVALALVSLVVAVATLLWR